MAARYGGMVCRWPGHNAGGLLLVGNLPWFLESGCRLVDNCASLPARVVYAVTQVNPQSGFINYSLKRLELFGEYTLYGLRLFVK